MKLTGLLAVIFCCLAQVCSLDSALGPPVHMALAPPDGVEITWAVSSNAVYSLEHSTDLDAWHPLYQNIRGLGLAARAQPVHPPAAFYRVAAAEDPASPVRLRQWVDDFSWPLEADPNGQQARDYRRFNRLDAERGSGSGGTGFRSLSISNGRLLMQATNGAFVFVFHSLVRGQSDPETLNFSAPLPEPIQPAWQMPVRAVHTVVRGAGDLKLELKDRNNQVLWLRTIPVASPESWITREVALTDADPLSQVKWFNLVGVGPCDLEVAEVSLIHEVPGWLYHDPLRYAFVVSYAALRRAYDPASGRTRDKVHLGAGSFDSLPACGFQALGAALASDLGLIRAEDAGQIASRSVAALAAAPRHQGLLPHWMANGQPVNYSTVDAALALIAALEAASILNLPAVETTVLGLIDAIDWTPLTNPQNEVSHGYAGSGTVLPYVWTDWGGESSLVQLLRLLESTNAPLFNIAPHPPVFGGRGFIVELGALLVPQLGDTDQPDRHEVVWRSERQRMLTLNRAYFPIHYPSSLAARSGLYGLSVVETIDDHATTSYLEGGIGAGSIPARDGGGWIAPHYAATTASLSVALATNVLRTLRDLELLTPLMGLPESVQAGQEGDAPARWHSVQVTLNVFFNVAGLYHAIRAQDGGRDAAYECARTHPRLKAALTRLFPPPAAEPQPNGPSRWTPR